MEIDLLCADSRVVVEIDGAQHLADPVAYRRDRRKDQLLQENGYLVLRYLAEDLAKELDSVLDGILRSLSARHEFSGRDRAECGGVVNRPCLDTLSRSEGAVQCDLARSADRVLDAHPRARERSRSSSSNV